MKPASKHGLATLLLAVVFFCACSAARVPGASATRRSMQSDSVSCSSNLACVTNLVPTIPPFSVNLPSIPTPDNSNLLSILNPTELVSYVQSKLPQNVQDSLSLGSNLLNQLQCGQSTLPIFTTETITSPGFLGSLSADSCQNINSVPGNSYLVGAMSTKAASFLSKLTSSQKTQVENAKAGGKDYAVCLAVDPCNLDFYLGFSGLKSSWTVPLGELPPATLEVEFKSLAYSNSGTNAGIQETAIGLWTYDMLASDTPDATSILGNVDAVVGATLSWGYVVNGKKVATISVQGDIETVVKFSNPTSFALQTKAQPKIDLYDSQAFSIDFSKLADALTTSMLFYVHHQNANNWDVVAGVEVNTNLAAVFSAVPGAMGQVLSKMVSSDSNIDVKFNLHMDQNGAGVRVYLSGQVGLASGFADLIRTFAPNAQTSFSSGLGVKLLLMPINGQTKVFGFVNIAGTEWSYGFCSSNSDCMTGQYCYVGVCATAVGCLASQGRDYVGDVSFIGNCPSGSPGTVQFGRCYQGCRSGYVTGGLGDVSRICYEDCNCGTELFGASLCSDNFPGVPICNVATARSRGWYDRTVDLTCPAGSSPVATTCWGNCPSGWVTGTTGDVAGRSSALNCYMSNCPADFPTMCLSGLTQVCVKAGVSCSSPQVIGALWGKCGASTTMGLAPSASMQASVTKPTCQAGFYLDKTALVCRPCVAGTYCPGGIFGSINCPINHYCPYGSNATISCPADHPNAPPSSYQLSQCTVCSPGFYRDMDTQKCAVCPAGAYCPGMDGTINQCTSGYYCPAISASPVNCPTNSTTGMFQVSLPGATDVNMCVSCTAGSIYSANPMPTDIFYTGDIHATCVPNPAGIYTYTGARATSPCPAGMYCAAGVPALACPSNTWSNQGSSAASQCATPSCPAGTYLGGGAGIPASLTSCMSCPVGFYCPGGSGLTAVTPIACPTRTSTNGGASSVAGCLSCPAGTTQGFYNKGPRWFDMSGQGKAQLVCMNCNSGFCGVVSLPG